MTKEQIIEQLEKSQNEYNGLNEANDDAAFYIAAEFEKKGKEMVKFASWLRLNNYTTSVYMKNMWCVDSHLSFEMLTIDELYELFKKEKIS